DLAVDPRPLAAIHAEPEPGLVRVFEQAHVGAVVAVTHLHPQGVQHAISRGRHSEFLAPSHQPIPDLASPGRLDVQLPTQLAHIGDTLCEHSNPVDGNRAGAHEWKTFLGYVVAGDTLHHGSGARAPDADDG